jgi:predicted phosphodiesterase
VRIAALYDIHGNLPALDAVLADVRCANVDRIVVGGDVLPGPMPRETLQRLLNLDMPVEFIHGNGELAVLAQMAAPDPRDVTYWGTTSGRPLPEPLQEVLRWTGRQLDAGLQRDVAGWPATCRLEIDGLGAALFCHATPRNETECFTRLTPEDRLVPIFDAARAAIVVCGHTHMQFDRMIARTRVVNAGSVGSPFQEPGAYWLLLGPDVQLRRTEYDLADAADRIRRTMYPQAEEFASKSVLQPPTEAATLELFEKAALTR